MKEEMNERENEWKIVTNKERYMKSIFKKEWKAEKNYRIKKTIKIKNEGIKEKEEIYGMKEENIRKEWKCKNHKIM